MEAVSPAVLGPLLGVGAVFMLSALAPFLALPLALLAFGRIAAEVAAPAISLIEAASDAAHRIAQGLLGLVLCAVLATVLLRYVFGVGSNALQETALYAHGAAFLLAAPAALGRGAHVRVDVFFAHFSPKQRALVDVLAFHLFLAPMTLAILIMSGPLVAQSWRIAEPSPESDGLPFFFLIKTLIPVFAVLLLAQGVAWASRAAALLRDLPGPPVRFEPQEGAGPA